METSAAAKLIKNESETPAARTFFTSTEHDFCSSILLETELRRVSWRYGISQADADIVLSRFAIYELENAAFAHAGAFPQPHLRSLDALHTAAALRLNADAVIAYDDRVQSAARTVGLQVLAPGQ